MDTIRTGWYGMSHGGNTETALHRAVLTTNYRYLYNAVLAAVNVSRTVLSFPVHLYTPPCNRPAVQYGGVAQSGGRAAPYPVPGTGAYGYLDIPTAKLLDSSFGAVAGGRPRTNASPSG